MRRFLRFVFNCLRNLSLLLVVILFSMVLFHVYGEEVMAAAGREAGQTDRDESGYGMYASPDEAGFGLFGETEEKPTRIPTSEQRYKIPLRRGFAYLNFSEFIYFQPRDGYFVAVGGYTFPTDLTLRKFYRLVSDNSDVPLFRTKSTLINCQHVMGVRAEYLKQFGSYDYYANLRNGDSIKLSKTKYLELIGMMDRQRFISELNF